MEPFSLVIYVVAGNTNGTVLYNSETTGTCRREVDSRIHIVRIIYEKVNEGHIVNVAVRMIFKVIETNLIGFEVIKPELVIVINFVKIVEVIVRNFKIFVEAKKMEPNRKAVGNRIVVRDKIN